MLPSYVDLRPWPPGKVRSCCSLAATTVTASAARLSAFHRSCELREFQHNVAPTCQGLPSKSTRCSRARGCGVKARDGQGAPRLPHRCCVPRSAQARRRAHRSQRRTSRRGDTRANTAAWVKPESEACFAFTRAARPCTETVIADRPQGGSCRAPQGEGAA